MAFTVTSTVPFVHEEGEATALTMTGSVVSGGGPTQTEMLSELLSPSVHVAFTVIVCAPAPRADVVKD